MFFYDQPTKTKRLLAGLMGALFVSLLVLGGVGQARAASDSSDNQLIVQLASGTDLATINSSYATTLARHLPGNQTYLLNVPAGQSADSIIAAMQGDNRLVYAEANYKAYLTETNQIFIYQDQNATPTTSASPTQSNWAFNAINLTQARSLSQGQGVKIALIDSGVMVSHPALNGHLVGGYNFLQNNTDVTDSNGHGTFVAGLMAQVAPQAQIMPVVVVGSAGYGTIADAAQGLYYAADGGATVINFSLGLYYPSKLLQQAVQYAQGKGAVVIASVGNQDTNQARYPAAYAQVLGVAATDQQNHKASFSNYGSGVSLSAPGVNLYSAYWQGGYATGSGTSFAVPLVAGETALSWSLHPGWTALQLGNWLDQTATSLVQQDPVYGSHLGHGLINVYQACLNR